MPFTIIFLIIIDTIIIKNIIVKINGQEKDISTVKSIYNLKEEFLEILNTKCKEKAKKLMLDWIMYPQNSGLI